MEHEEEVHATERQVTSSVEDEPTEKACNIVPQMTAGAKKAPLLAEAGL